MSYNNIKISIKEHEGFELVPYQLEYGNTKENFFTGGYGHKLLKLGESIAPRTKEDWEEVFEMDFQIALDGARSLLNEEETDPIAFGIVIEMIYQMGVKGCSGFKKMHKAIKNKEYLQASFEMENSRWCQQTRRRAEALAVRMKNI